MFGGKVFSVLFAMLDGKLCCNSREKRRKKRFNCFQFVQKLFVNSSLLMLPLFLSPILFQYCTWKLLLPLTSRACKLKFFSPFLAPISTARFLSHPARQTTKLSATYFIETRVLSSLEEGKKSRMSKKNSAETKS